MSDNESVGLEKPKNKRNYVRTPARDEAIKKMREAREKALKDKAEGKPIVQEPVQQVQQKKAIIEDPTPKVSEKPKKQLNKQVTQILDVPKEEEEEEEEKVIIKKKPTKKKPTIVYIESESESEPEKIIIKKSKSKKKKVIESSSEEESSEEEEEEIKPIKPFYMTQQPPKLRFL
jgi:hypothetical protein